MRATCRVLSSLTLSEAKDNGAGALENSNGNFPAPQDINNLDADFGTVRLQPAVQQHDELRLVAALRARTSLGRERVGRARPRSLGGWQLAGINTVVPGEPVTLTYTPAAAFQVSGIQQDFRGANNYRPNVIVRSVRAGGPVDQQLVQQGLRRRCRPTRASRSATPRATACAGRTSGRSTWRPASRSPLGGQSRLELRLEAFNLFNRDNFTRAERQPQLGRLRHDHVDLRPAAAAARRQSDLVVRQSPS